MDQKASIHGVPTVVLTHEKPKRRRLRVGDPDFVPPDGGWGWLIVFACGFSNVSIKYKKKIILLVYNIYLIKQ